MSIAEILKKLRTDKKISQKAMAELLNVSQQAYARYETGHAEPNISSLITLADYYNVSIDYLIGKSTTTHKNLINEVVEQYQLNAKEEKILKNYLNMPVEKRHKLLDTVLELFK